MNGVPITIVGIAPQGFEGIEAGGSTDFWIPLQSRAELNAWGNPPEDGKTYIADPTWWCLQLIGRLAPGVTKSQAVARMQPTFQAAAYWALAIRSGEKTHSQPAGCQGLSGFERTYRKPLHMLMTMVGFVLLIALSNVVMLLMARNATRQREFSLRLALGAGYSELFRQLTESLLLVIAGGALAWFFAASATKALEAGRRSNQASLPTN